MKNYEELVLKKSNRFAAVYLYRVPKWMAWAQIETLVLEMNRHEEIRLVTRYPRDLNVLEITTRGLVDPFRINEMLELELAYVPGPNYRKRVLNESDFESMNLEELKYVNEHPEMFEFKSESGSEGRGVE